MTTAEKYRQLEKSPVINIARFIFNDLKNVAVNTTLEKVIAEIKTGKTPSKQEKRYYEDDFFDWFKPDEIGSEKYLYNAKDKVSKYAYETKQATIFEPDTILINAIGDVGRISILKKQASSNQQITGILLKEVVSVDYTYFYLLAHREYFYVDLFQTTLPIVNQKKINSIPFCYPSLNEQERIVKGLEEIENIKSINDLQIIENLDWKEDYKEICRNFFNLQFGTAQINNELTHQLDLIKQLRQAFLREAMQGKLVGSVLLKVGSETGHDLLAKIKAEKAKLIKEKKLKSGLASSQTISLINDIKIPSHWVWCKTDEIFFITKLAGFEYSKHFKLSKNGEIPVVRAQNVRALNIDKKNLLYIDRQTSELLERCALTKKSLLVTFIGAGIGDVATFEENERWHLAPNVAKMEPFIGCENLMSLKFINYFMMSDLGQKEIFKHVKATAQPSLSMGTIRDIDVPLPPLHEQEQIVAKLEELMAFCDGLEQSIKESQGYNEMLLQQVLREALQPKEEVKKI